MLDYFEDELFEAEGGEDYTEDRVMIDGRKPTIPNDAEGEGDVTDDTAE